MSTEKLNAFTSIESAVEHYEERCVNLARQLSDTKADLQEFEDCSRELQVELEKDMAQMEKAEKDMRIGWEKARGEIEELQSRYNSKLREHTATLGQMTKELDSTRAAEKALRTKLRDMELDNDDLEKSEREKDSSLQDFEARYGRAIERIALLEEELVEKAAREEEIQRLKDEIREQGEEMEVMRKQQSSTYPPAYPRPLTPPATVTQPSRDDATSPAGSSTSSHHKSTQRTRNDSLGSSTTGSPKIGSTDATPRQKRTTSLASLPNHKMSPPPPPATTSPPPPLPTRPPSGVTPLSRSFRGQVPSPATPSAVRERRANNFINEIKERTDETRNRLQQRATMARSSIPRKSMGSPSNPAPGRIPEVRRVASLGMSMTPGGRNGDHSRLRSVDVVEENPLGRTIRRANASESYSGVSSGGSQPSSRPSSRASLRMSVSGSQQRTVIPTRPSSRISMGSGIPLPALPRSQTPTQSFPLRPSTPSGLRSTTDSRPRWGAPSLPSTLATSSEVPSRRRLSTMAPSAHLGASTNGRVRGSVDLGAGTASKEKDGAGGIGLGRRMSSIGLGRNVSVRRPSGSG